jgi:chemotaxis protein MotB
MMRRRRRDRAGDESATEYWASYSDLLAAMLLVFVLLLVVSMFHYADFIRQKEDRLEAREERLTAFREIERRLIDDLRDAIDQELVTIDPETGNMRIESGILFAEGSAELNQEGRERLRRLFDDYIRVVLDPRFAEFLERIEIEGHTNSNGGYLYNLELSQQRAAAVMRELLDHGGERADRLKEIVVASGRSFSHLIRDAQGREDSVRSRRIEIQFRLEEAEMMRDLARDLEAGSGGAP